MPDLIPITVIVTTKNEEANIAHCLGHIKAFSQVIVVDSDSTDKTVEIAQSFNAEIVRYQWNGQYPKKRQWCLDNLDIKNDYVFFVDADEVITADLTLDIKQMDYTCAGYFVRGSYVWNEKTLRHGLQNNKLCLFHKDKIEFPIVNDLDIEGMGEIEGHYQPVLKSEYASEVIGQLYAPLNHNAYSHGDNWHVRHLRYARWEAEMIKRGAYPKDPDSSREHLKSVFRKLPCRNLIAFLHSYVMKLGFLDGGAGFQFARSRYQYYSMVSNALKTNKA